MTVAFSILVFNIQYLFAESLTVILSKSLSLAHSLNITCLRSTSYVTTVRWYKDGILLTQTGTSLIINTPAPNDQGHYQCSVDLMGIRVFSDKKLVTFKGKHTLYLYFYFYFLLLIF